MEPMMTEKRELSTFFPYRMKDGVREYYLQRRSKDAKVLPGKLGMFGGGLEGNETPQEALMREVKEELSYEPRAPRYFSRYESATNVYHIFFEEVPEEFESLVTVLEGDYGIFMTYDDITTHAEVSHGTRAMLPQLDAVIAARPAASFEFERPLMTEKRPAAGLFPYTRIDGALAFYLQKRDEEAPLAPGVFGSFGGGIEGEETPEEAMLREMQEELRYTPKHARYFSKYETADAFAHAFIEEVTTDFGDTVTVCEGEYGKFLTVDEIRKRPDVYPETRLIVHQIAEELEK